MEKQNNNLNENKLNNSLNQLNCQVYNCLSIFRQKIYDVLTQEFSGKSEVLVRFESCNSINCFFSYLINYNKKKILVILEKIEEFEKEYDFDFMLIEKVFKLLNEMSEFYKKEEISINLYPSTIYNENFIKDFESLLKKYRIDPRNVVIEILERDNYIGENEEQRIYYQRSKIDIIQININYLKEKYGIKFSIDDYLNGSNNYYFLTKIKGIDYIKIDRMFLLELFKRKTFYTDFQNLINEILELHPNIEIIVEGIENEEQFQAISKFSPIKFSQGYYHHKPELFK